MNTFHTDNKSTIEVILSSISVQVALLDPDGHIQLVNEAWEKVACSERRSLIYSTGVGDNYPQRCGELAAPIASQGQGWPQTIQRVLKGVEKEFYLEYAYPHRQELSWYALKVTALNDSIEGAIIQHEDISQRKKIENRLRESEANAKILFDYSPILIWEEDFSEIKGHFNLLAARGITDFKAYFNQHPEEVQRLSALVKVIQVNKRSLDFYQARNFEELNTRLPDWFLPQSLEIFRDELISLAEGKMSYENEILILTPSKEIKYLFIKLSVPPQYAATLKRVLVSFIDITELKLARKKLVELNAQLEQKVIERTSDLLKSESKLLQAQKIAKIGTWELDLETGEIAFSSQFYENFGLDPGTPPAVKLFLDHIHPDDREFMTQLIQGSARPGMLQSFNFKVITSSGELRYMVGMSEIQLPHQNAPSRKMLGVLQDITNLKQKESEHLKDILTVQENERERISAELHDSINPLLSIASFNAETILSHIQDNKSIAIDQIDNVIGLLQNAMEGIKEISSNLDPASLKNFGLAQAVQQLTNKMRQSGMLKVDCLTYGLEERVDPQTELALYRIIQELLNNILKHAGATTVELQLIRHKNSIVLMLSDNGKGFSTTLLEQRTTGFGFKNISSRVRSLNGQLNIDSNPNIGTTVIVEFPLKSGLKQ